MTSIILTIDDAMDGVYRDRTGLGWRRFAGDVPLPCDSCGDTVTAGFIDTMGRQKRCTECVVTVFAWGKKVDGGKNRTVPHDRD